ncbi:MAG: hypothetical protein ABSB73_11625 [Solirubrobacteraceae bacterium]|jgi:hypothetical protein
MPIGAFSAIPTPQTTIGIAKETVRGTAVAPEYFLPVMSPAYKPNREYLPDESLQGSMVGIYDEIPGLRYDAHGWDQHLYLDSFPLLVQGVLGAPDTVTAAPASTTLAAAAAAGATTISTMGSVASGSFITIAAGSPGTIETHQTTAVTGSGPYTVTLAFPLIYSQASGASVTGLTKHQFSLLNNSPTTGNQPPSYTISDYAGEASWRQLTAAQLDGLNLQGSPEALPKATVSWFANPAVAPGVSPVASYTTAESPPGWTAQLIIGGAPIAYVVSWEADLKRGVKPIPAITGTQQYWQYYAGVLASTAKFTVLEDTNQTWLTAFESGATETVDLTVYDIQNGWAINLHSSKAKITSGSLDRSKEWLEVPLELVLLPTAADALAAGGGVSPCVITCANAVSAAY